MTEKNHSDAINRLFDAVGDINEEMIERAGKSPREKIKKRKKLRLAAVAAAALIAVSVFAVTALPGDRGKAKASPSVEISTNADTDEVEPTSGSVDMNGSPQVGGALTDKGGLDGYAGMYSGGYAGDFGGAETAAVGKGSYGGTGGSHGCYVHDMAYHGYLPEFVEYVGVEKFQEWEKETEKYELDGEDECRFPNSNIYEFVRFFNYPKEEFIKVYNSNIGYYYANDWDIDLLYEGTAEENDKYYRETLHNSDRYKRINFDSLKTDLFLDNIDKIEAISGKKANMNDFSFIELIYLLGIPREEAERRISASVEDLTGEMKSVYDYNLDMVYGDRENTEALIAGHSVFYMDLLFCGLEPREAPYV